MSGQGRLRHDAEAVLRAAWREGVDATGTRYAYTSPASRYPDQFFWDSCLIALAWSRIDPARARAELRTLAAAQRPDGFIGHTIFWRGPVRLARRYIYNLISADARTTSTIQPPLLGHVWAEVADRSPDDPGFRAEGLEPVGRLHEWLERERADEHGLIGILQPDESGLDATPAYDAPLGWRRHPRLGFVQVLRFNRRRGYDYRRVVADGGFHATDVLVNAAWVMGWSGLARLGHPGADARAAELTRALVARLHDPETGMFFPRGPGGARLPVSTWAGLSPLALEHLPDDIGRRLVHEHLLNPARYWLPHPVPSVSAEEPSFRPGRVGRPVPQYWRGATWLFTHPFLLPGLLRLGEADAARELVTRTAGLVERAGFREYYEPFTGEGLGARDFAVSTVIVDLLARLGA